MGVEVDQKRGKGRLQSIRASLLGDGLLERARATTLGLLGATTAVGLAMLALVFNQGWPLVAGGPVPPLPPREQAVAKAKVAAANAPGQVASVAGVARRRHDSGRSGSRQGPTPQTGATQAPSDELVVAPAAQVEQQGDAPSSGVHARPAPAKPKATPSPQTQTQAAAPTQTEAAEQTPAPPPAQIPEPPAATVSEAPESSVPSWSSGKGHAYGRNSVEGEDGD
jgi:hypothetical protein